MKGSQWDGWCRVGDCMCVCVFVCVCVCVMVVVVGSVGGSQQSLRESNHSTNINQRTSRPLILPSSTRNHSTHIIHVVVLKWLQKTEQEFDP